MITLYAQLTTLAVGDTVPDSIYVADYANGDRPAWRVVGREALSADGVRLDLEDAHNHDMFDTCRVIVLAFPDKVLRTRPQPHNNGSPAQIGAKLCDMEQQARYHAKVKQ